MLIGLTLWKTPNVRIIFPCKSDSSRALHANGTNSEDTTRIFFENLSLRLKLSNIEDWYKVTEKDVEKHGGADILANHSNSLTKALISAYPGIYLLLVYYIVRIIFLLNNYSRYLHHLTKCLITR